MTQYTEAQILALDPAEDDRMLQASDTGTVWLIPAWKGGSSAVSAGTGNPTFLPDITTYTNSGSSSLDSLSLTADTIANGGDIGRTFQFKEAVSGLIETYVARAGTDAQSVAAPWDIVRPNNYAATTNEVVLERVAHALPSPLQVDSLTLVDGSAIVLPSGSITGGATPHEIRIHNGSDPGGILYAPVSQFRIRKRAVGPTGSGANRCCAVQLIGSCTIGGDLTVTFIGPPVAESPVTHFVTVAAGDTPAVWGDKILAILEADSSLTDHYRFIRVGGYLVAQELVYTGVDVFSIDIAVGTTSGITAKTSAQVPASQYFPLKLGTLIIPASYVQANQKFYLHGVARCAVDTTASAAYLAIMPDMSAIGLNSILNISARYELTARQALDGFSSNMDFTQGLVFNEAAGLLGLDGSGFAAGETGTWRGTETVYSSGWATVDGSGLVEIGATSVDQIVPGIDLRLDFVFLAGLAAGASPPLSTIDLTLEPVDQW